MSILVSQYFIEKKVKKSSISALLKYNLFVSGISPNFVRH